MWVCVHATPLSLPSRGRGPCGSARYAGPMYLSRVQLEGFRGAAHADVEGGRVGAASGPVGDAIDLLSAALAPDRARVVAERLGWWGAQSAVVGEGADVGLQGLHAPSVTALLADEVRAVTVEGALALDPPLYGRLREHAVRDPRMVVALGQEPVVHVKVGWLFAKDRTSAHPTVLHFRVGDVGFETGGKDRPAWLPDLLVELGRRFHRTDPFESPSVVAARLLAAALSPDPRVRAGYERMGGEVGRAPFHVPAPGLVRAGERLDLVFGPELLTARQVGRVAVDAVRWAEAAFVVRPDVLVVDEAGADAHRGWWSALVESDDAPVEQVWLR